MDLISVCTHTVSSSEAVVVENCQGVKVLHAVIVVAPTSRKDRGHGLTWY